MADDRNCVCLHSLRLYIQCVAQYRSRPIHQQMAVNRRCLAETMPWPSSHGLSQVVLYRTTCLSMLQCCAEM